MEYLLSNTRTTERGGSAFPVSIEGAATSCALSRGTYAGSATHPLNPEPYVYESGFAVKWLIGDQIAGKAERNYHPAKGPVAALWCEWGPYVWAHGIKANRDGLSDMRADYSEQDGTHPSPSGRIKVATRLVHFLKTDPRSRVWLMAENPQ